VIKHSIALSLFVSLWFQDLFHSPYRGSFHLSLTVLVHYRSVSSILPWRGGPPDSDRIIRVPSYSGYSPLSFQFGIRGFHPLWPSFPACSPIKTQNYASPTTPALQAGPVWAFSRSLAATSKISVDYFSCRYLDVSVHCVRSSTIIFSSRGYICHHMQGYPIRKPPSQRVLDPSSKISSSFKRPSSPLTA
jgi:hypothetical protein